MTRPVLHVGQELWCVSDYSPKSAYFATVTKVCRKWAHLSTGERLNMETMRVGHWADMRCFLSQEDYARYVAANNAWNDLRNAMSMARRSRPDCVGVDAIRQAASLLGLADCLKDIDP